MPSIGTCILSMYAQYRYMYAQSRVRGGCSVSGPGRVLSLGSGEGVLSLGSGEGAQSRVRGGYSVSGPGRVL